MAKEYMPSPRVLKWSARALSGREGATNAIKPDRRITFDKLTNVHYSGTRHDEDQPVHLLVHTEVCHTICTEEYGNPCQRFIHRGMNVGIARDALEVSQSLFEGLPERDADVLGGVMMINVKIARGGHIQVEAGMMSEKIKHVVEKANAGRDRRSGLEKLGVLRALSTFGRFTVT